MFKVRPQRELQEVHPWRDKIFEKSQLTSGDLITIFQKKLSYQEISFCISYNSLERQTLVNYNCIKSNDNATFEIDFSESLLIF